MNYVMNLFIYNSSQELVRDVLRDLYVLVELRMNERIIECFNNEIECLNNRNE